MTDKLREELQLLIDTRFSVDTDELQAMLDNHPALAAKPVAALAEKVVTCSWCGSDEQSSIDGACGCCGTEPICAAPQPAPEREVDEAFLSLCEAVGVPATKFAAQEYRARVTSPADRDALVEMIRPYVGVGMAHALADALLARGLRLPSVDVNETTVHSHQGGLMCADDTQAAGETMAWAVVSIDGQIMRVSRDGRELAEKFAGPGDSVKPIAIRLVEGGDDA